VTSQMFGEGLKIRKQPFFANLTKVLHSISTTQSLKYNHGDV